jgi:hypothetical protein
MERNHPDTTTPRPAKRLLGRMLSWGREHLLLTSAVLGVPLAVGAFFWSRETAEVSLLPGDPLTGSEAIEEATLDPESEKSFLKPLPASAETLELIEKRKQGCVWLTGTIEPVDSQRIQNASRVHELTTPARQ